MLKCFYKANMTEQQIHIKKNNRQTDSDGQIDRQIDRYVDYEQFFIKKN